MLQLFAFLFAQKSTHQGDTLYIINSISSEPLHNVKLISGSGKIFLTNIDGQLYLKDISIVDFPLIVTKKNYHSINLNRFSTKKVIRLKPIIFLADEVRIIETVFKSELNLPIKSHYINSTQIEGEISAQSLVESLPSVTLKSYGGRAGISTVSIHGGQSQRFSVMFDGVPINNEQNGGADISQIPIFLLSNLEYLSQGHSSRFATSAMTGLLNFSPSKEATKVSLSRGNFKEWSIGSLFSKSFKKTKLTLGFGRSNYDAKYSYRELGNYSDAYPDLGKIYSGLSNSILKDYVYLHYKYKTLILSYFNVKNVREISTSVYSPPIEIKKMLDGLQTLSYSFKFSNSKISHNRKQTTIGYLSDNHSLITNNFSFSNINGDFISTISMINIFSESSRLPNMSKTYYSGTINHNKSWDNVILSSSFKAENEENSMLVFSYDFIINNHISRNLTSSVTFSHNYKKPNFNDLFWEPFGDPNLETEYSDNFYLKNQLLSKFGELNINTHYISFDNLISWHPMVGSNTYWIPENISSAKSYGIDISYKSNPFISTSIFASYSLSNTENYNRSLSQNHQGKPLMHSPKHSASFVLQSRINRSMLRLSVKFIGDRIQGYSWPNDNLLPNYFTTNITYKYKLSNTYKFEKYIHLKSENIFDIQYQSVHGYPVPGHSYSITLTIKESK